MSVDGDEVYKDLKEKVREVEKKHEQVTQQVYQCETEITTFTEERENCFASLALTYLPELVAEDVKNTLRGVQEEVQKIFRQKQDRRKTIEQEMSELQEQKQEKQQTLEEITGKLNVKGEERDRLREEIGKELDAKKDYVELKSNVIESGNLLDRNKKRAGEMKQEAKEKLPQYGGNKLFMYLASRNFGTPEYTGKGIFAHLDSWVAEIVNYGENRKNYDFLRTMPVLMEEKVKEKQAVFEKLNGRVTAIEKEAEDRHGLTKILEQGEELVQTRKGVIAEIGVLDGKYFDDANERKELDNTKDKYHEEAIKKLKSYLKGESISALKEQARATPGTQDDQLAGRIEEIDLRIRTLKDDAKKYAESRDSVAEKLSGLKSIQTKFSRADYESSRSYFNDFNLTSLLAGYVLGEHSENDIWGHIERNQNFKPRQTYSSPSSPSYSRPSFGGGFGGGGGFSGGGGFGGGGHSSGSGF